MDYEGQLADGTRVLFRHIRPDDKAQLVAGFEQLSEESRYRRFFRRIDHLTDEQLRYLTEVDFEDHFAWIAVLPDLPESPGVAVGRWIRIPGEPDVAESAITVIDAYQGNGLGSTMLWLLGRSAAENGVGSLRVWVQGDNSRVLAMLRDFGIVPRHWEGGISEIDVPLPDVDSFSDTPARILLKAVASGELQAEGLGTGGARTRFIGDGNEEEGTGSVSSSGSAPDRT